MSSSPTLVDSPTGTGESSKRTNTLVLTQLPIPFFHPRVMDALHHHFALHGSIRAWAPLRTFGRVIVVYESEDSADDAKMYCDGLQIDGTPETPPFVLRVFRADPTQLTPPGGSHLRPPAIEKNFLISPPGSPPVGWEQVVEEPPNAAPLAEDLITALRKLQLVAGAASGGGREMILDPEDGVGIGVYVEDCDMLYDEVVDDDGERDWVYGEDNPSRVAYRPAPTALPPLPS
ncbi:calcineurin-binding protein [Lactifluus volemus]|nr:calcineurin-binding protein [Lactifluus volemus]